MGIEGRIKEIHFQFEQVANQHILSQDRAVYRFDVTRSEYIPDLILSLQRFVATMGLDKIEHPETWWDALKDRWFPKWAKKRWPPQFKVYDALAFFPELHRHIPMTEEQIRQEYGSFHIGFLERYNG